MGLKITACMFSEGKFWTKDWKRPKNPAATFEEFGAKKQGTAHAPELNIT